MKNNRLILEEIKRIHEMMGIKPKITLNEAAINPIKPKYFDLSFGAAAKNLDASKAEIENWATTIGKTKKGGGALSYDDMVTKGKQLAGDTTLSDADALYMFAKSSGKSNFDSLMTSLSKNVSQTNKALAKQMENDILKLVTDDIEKELTDYIDDVVENLDIPTASVTELDRAMGTLFKMKSAIGKNTDASLDDVVKKVDELLDETATIIQSQKEKLTKKSTDFGVDETDTLGREIDIEVPSRPDVDIPPKPDVDTQFEADLIDAQVEIGMLQATISKDPKLKKAFDEAGISETFFEDLLSKIQNKEITKEQLQNQILANIKKQIENFKSNNKQLREEGFEKIKQYGKIFGVAFDGTVEGAEKIAVAASNPKVKWGKIILASFGITLTAGVWFAFVGPYLDKKDQNDTEDKNCIKDKVQGYLALTDEEEDVFLSVVPDACNLFKEGRDDSTGEKTKCPHYTIPTSVRIQTDEEGNKEFVVSYLDGTPASYEYENPKVYSNRVCSKKLPLDQAASALIPPNPEKEGDEKDTKNTTTSFTEAEALAHLEDKDIKGVTLTKSGNDYYYTDKSGIKWRVYKDNNVIGIAYVEQ